MPRALLLIAVCASVCLGCFSQRENHRAPTDALPNRVVEGASVVGTFTDDDVAAILASVRALTDKPIISVYPPRDAYNSYRRGETDAVPADTADVATGEGAGDWIYLYHLSKRNGEWAVRDSSVIMT
jgi:hypothetical protein